MSELRNRILIVDDDPRAAQCSSAPPLARYVTAAVEASGGNVRKAARQLKISPSTLYARIKR